MSRFEGLRSTVQRYFRKHLNLDVLPCPACGKEDQMWCGVDSAATSGVGCYRCRLKITRPFPRLYPRKMPKSIRGNAIIDWLYCHCMFITLKTWNRMPRRVKK